MRARGSHRRALSISSFPISCLLSSYGVAFTCAKIDRSIDIPVPAAQADLVKKGAKELSIKDLAGKVVVVAFYPKALTGG